MSASNGERIRVFQTELGWMALALRGKAVTRLSFGHREEAAAGRAIGRDDVEADSSPLGKTLERRLIAFAQGAPDDFSDVLVEQPASTPFTAAVFKACRAIAYGKTRSYGQLAAAAGRPRAARAVGNVMASNQVPIIVPCHRIVPSTGALGGFSAPGGVGTKARLLEMEASGGLPQLARAAKPARRARLARHRAAPALA